MTACCRLLHSEQGDAISRSIRPVVEDLGQAHPQVQTGFMAFNNSGAVNMAKVSLAESAWQTLLLL